MKRPALLIVLLMVVSACRAGQSVLPTEGLGTATLAPRSSPTPIAPIPSTEAPTPTSGTGVSPLATPVSDQPAAGICGGTEDRVLTVTIYPDIPDPRCAIVRPDQVLRVVSQRQETLQVSLAGLKTTLEPGGEYTFSIPFGELLAPGVHRLEVLPCCGSELWLQEGP